MLHIKNLEAIVLSRAEDIEKGISEISYTLNSFTAFDLPSASDASDTSDYSDASDVYGSFSAPSASFMSGALIL